MQMAEKRAGEPLPRKMLALKTLTDDWLPYSIATKAQADLEAFYQYNGMTKATVWREIDLWNVAYQRYAACDVLDTARLHPLLKASVSVIVGQDVLDRERALDAFSVRSERRGFLLDMKRIDAEIAASAGKDSEIDKLKAELKDKYGLVNPNAAKQIADAIERETGTRPTTTDADGNVKDSTSADTLKLMTGSACAATVLKYKKLNKVESTYGVVWKDKYADANGYAHPSLNPRGSSTGRMTMTSPSLLNVPQEAREYVIAEPGYVFVQSDFSAVEVRIGGAEAGDKQMYADLAGGADPYSIVAPRKRSAKPSPKLIATHVSRSCWAGCMGARLTAWRSSSRWQILISTWRRSRLRQRGSCGQSTVVGPTSSKPPTVKRLSRRLGVRVSRWQAGAASHSTSWARVTPSTLWFKALDGSCWWTPCCVSSRRATKSTCGCRSTTSGFCKCLKPTRTRRYRTWQKP